MLPQAMNTLLYFSRLHIRFRAAYEHGQKESRELSGYGNRAMIVYAPRATDKLKL